MKFADIPDRTPGKVDVSWWNALKTAGKAIESFLGAGFVQETAFTIANNSGVAANVTGLVFDKTSYKSAIVSVEIRRKTDTNESVCNGTLSLLYRDLAAAWEIVENLSGDSHGLTLSITSGGQVQYTSDNMTGANYSGKLKFKAISFAV